MDGSIDDGEEAFRYRRYRAHRLLVHAAAARRRAVRAAAAAVQVAVRAAGVELNKRRGGVRAVRRAVRQLRRLRRLLQTLRLRQGRRTLDRQRHTIAVRVACGLRRLAIGRAIMERGGVGGRYLRRDGVRTPVCPQIASQREALRLLDPSPNRRARA